MEKLSKLLNEYLESKGKDIQQFMNITALMTQSGSKLYQTYIISKDFEFIKRLVDNYKIDRHKFYDKNILKWFMTLTKGEKIDSIIMNLSISDTPIEDLISYLK